MLIGLHGRAQAGKDTTFERLRDNYGERVVRFGFADLVYETAAAALGVTPELLRELKTDPEARVQLYTRTQPNRHFVLCKAEITVREYLQRVGTEGHRDIFGTDFWVDQLDPDIHDGQIHVVTDVRFANEALRIRQLGGVVARVLGPREIEDKADGHASEQPLPDYLVDVTIDNGYRALQETDGVSNSYDRLDAQLPRLVALASTAADRHPR